jgi:photosynthetic reaction center cytochrome c subunit
LALTLHSAGVALAAVIAALLATGCQRNDSEQRGYRGLGMLQVRSPAAVANLEVINKAPATLPRARSTGPTAGSEYQNVQVLGDLSKPEFARLMVSIKDWVSPEEGCGYCHNAPDFASDEKYAKRVAREMLRMTRHINSDWQAHVKTTGVTCYTCHRGNPVPPRTWTSVPAPLATGVGLRKSAIRAPAFSAARSTLPADPLSAYLLDQQPIRVAGPAALAAPRDDRRAIVDAESTYSMMLVMSESLGVNCTFCHNTRAFYSWPQSPPQRVTAWHGIQMARELNQVALAPLAQLLPPERLGPAGDVPKIYCATCHLGSGKPLGGVAMVQDFPELIGPKAALPAPPPMSARAAALGTGGAQR